VVAPDQHWAYGRNPPDSHNGCAEVLTWRAMVAGTVSECGLWVDPWRGPGKCPYWWRYRNWFCHKFREAGFLNWLADNPSVAYSWSFT